MGLRSTEILDEQRGLARVERSTARAEAADAVRAWKLGLFVTGRVFVALPFLVAAFEKARDPERARHLLGAGVVDLRGALPMIIAVELGLGLLLAAGLWTRRTAVAAIAWLGCAVLALGPDLGGATGRVVAAGNLALAGGLLMLAAHGPGRLSADHLRSQHRRRRVAAHRR